MTASSRGGAAAVLVALVFLGLAALFGIRSTAFHEADDVTHYAFSRWLFRYPAKIVDIWGRPLVTGFYALPAQLGPTAARISSVFLGAIVAWASVRLFQRAGGRLPALAVACTLGMPFVFLQLYGILTEIMFAATLGAGFVAYRRGMPRVAAISWSLMPLARPEGFFLAPVFALVFLSVLSAHRSRRGSLARFSCAALLGAGTLAWWLAGLPIYRRALWMVEEWPKNWRVESVYGDGHPLLFVGFLVLVATPVLFPFTVVGAVRFWRARLRLEVVVIAYIVLLHTILRTFGLFGSAGYPRYLVTLAPLVGALSATGVEAAIAAWEARHRPLSTRGRAAVVLALVAVLVGGVVVWPHSGPIHGGADAQMIRGVWPWCARAIERDPNVRFVADHPYFFALGDVDRVRNGMPFQPHAVAYAEVGTIAIFESKFAARYSGMRDPAMLEAHGFERVPNEEVVGPGPYPWEGPLPAWGDPELLNFQWGVFVKRR
jgi:hypothetical protein